MPRTLISFGIALALAGCASLPQDRAETACISPALAIDADFERGAMASCRLDGRRAATISIEPEAGATNDSAWYAFRVTTDEPASVKLRLRYAGGTHRYWPKLSTDGESWERLADAALLVSEERDTARLTIGVGEEPVFIAAQPLDTMEAALSRTGALLENAGFSAADLGASAEGRVLRVYENAPANPARLVVILARQHPPETSGAVAFEAFIGRLAEADAAATQFRNVTKILVAPMVNPDGFVNGHWRGNADGRDVNRDWGPFETSEARAVSERIVRLAADYDPAFFIDFHSTKRDVIYAAPEGADPDGAADAFLAELQRRLGEAAPAVSRSHVSARTTAKAWSLEALAVAGLTYEVADEASLPETTAAARVAAEALMTVMMTGAPAP